MFSFIKKLLVKKKRRMPVRLIKITKASSSELWYANRIGATFEVNPYLEEEGLYTIDFPYNNRYVRHEDCEILG